MALLWVLDSSSRAYGHARKSNVVAAAIFIARQHDTAMHSEARMQ